MWIILFVIMLCSMCIPIAAIAIADRLDEIIKLLKD